MYTSVLCFFVYFVSIARGLNRYDFERLLNGFVVCAVHIYINWEYCMSNQKRVREWEKSSERSDDVCCEANTIHSHTHTSTHTLMFTHAVSKQTNERTNREVRKTTARAVWIILYYSERIMCNSIYTPVNRLRIATVIQKNKKETPWKKYYENDDDVMWEMWKDKRIGKTMLYYVT